MALCNMEEKTLEWNPFKWMDVEMDLFSMDERWI